MLLTSPLRVTRGVFGWDLICSPGLDTSVTWKTFEGQSPGGILEDVVALPSLQGSSCWMLEQVWGSASTWASSERRTPKPCQEPNLHVVNARICFKTAFAGPGGVTGVGAAGGCCWRAAPGWQRAVHYKMFIPALIAPFAASLCNSQLCVLQLA